MSREMAKLASSGGPPSPTKRFHRANSQAEDPTPGLNPFQPITALRPSTAMPNPHPQATAEQEDSEPDQASGTIPQLPTEDLVHNRGCNRRHLPLQQV